MNRPRKENELLKVSVESFERAAQVAPTARLWNTMGVERDKLSILK